MKYTLTVTPKNGKFFHEVKDENGVVIFDQLKTREFAACTTHGHFFFGSVDKIGKGDHGKHVKWAAETGEEAYQIAYRA